MDPVIGNVQPPSRFKFKLPKLPGGEGNKWNRYITIGAAAVIILSIFSFGVFAYLTNNSKFKRDHNIGTSQNPDLPPETSGVTKSAAALPGGGIATGVGGCTGTNCPEITITAEPASVLVGKTSKITWKVANNPTSCTASEDWSGDKAFSGSESTPTLTKVQTYNFLLTCKSATGTSYSRVSVGAVAQGGSGGASRPQVSLAANPTSIFTNDSSTLSWEVGNGASSCTASGDWSGTKPTAGPATTGKLTTAKTYTYTLTCQNSAGTGFATATVKVTDPPPDLPVVSLSASPIGPLTPGGSSTLSWSTVNNPTTCTATGDWSGTKPANGTQSTGPLNTVKNYTFTLTCKIGNVSAFDTVSIGVLPGAPTVNLTITPPNILIGNSATLNWSATNSPTSCTASGDWSGNKSANGSQSTGTLYTAKAYLYNLSCTNAGGTGYVNNVRLNVNLPPAPTVSISANPISIKTGESSSLAWSTGNSPTYCAGSGDWSGTKNLSGGTQSTGALTTNKTYSYTLTCSNAGGSTSATTSVTVSSGTSSSPPAVTLAVSPSTIGTGSSSTLSWSVTNNPTSCTASGSWSGSQGSSGSTSTGVKSSAGSYTYTLNCSNAAGSNSKTVTLTVVATPVIIISISPSTITAGNSATIGWIASNNPSSCTASGNWSGTKAASGNQSVTPSSTGNYTYSLSCTNSGGSSTNSTTLTVNPASVPCGSGGTCTQADIAPHNTQSNCWSSINANGSGQKAYKISSTFISDHGSYKSVSTVVGRLCGQVFTSNLAGKASDHRNGAKIAGLNYDQYIANFYIGPYQ